MCPICRASISDARDIRDQPQNGEGAVVAVAPAEIWLVFKCERQRTLDVSVPDLRIVED